MSAANDLRLIMLQRTSSQSSQSSAGSSPTSPTAPITAMSPVNNAQPPSVSAPTALIGPQRPNKRIATAVHAMSILADTALLATLIYGRVQLYCPTSFVVPLVFNYYIIRFTMTISLAIYRALVPSAIEPDPFNMTVSAIAYKYIHFLLRGGMIVGFLAISTMILIDQPNCNATSDKILTVVVLYDLIMTIMIFCSIAAMAFLFGFNATCIAICPPAAIVISLSNSKPIKNAITSSDLKTLPIVTYQAGMFEPTDRQCAICLNEFSAGDSLRVLTRCAHHFHTTCVDLWLLQRGGTCPICRSVVHGDKRTANDDLRAAIERSVSHNHTSTTHHPNINQTRTRVYDDGFDREHDYALQSASHHYDSQQQPSPLHNHHHDQVLDIVDEVEMA